jgi:hypothetical protein
VGSAVELDLAAPAVLAARAAMPFCATLPQAVEPLFVATVAGVEASEAPALDASGLPGGAPAELLVA